MAVRGRRGRASAPGTTGGLGSGRHRGPQILPRAASDSSGATASPPEEAAVGGGPAPGCRGARSDAVQEPHQLRRVGRVLGQAELRHPVHPLHTVAGDRTVADDRDADGERFERRLPRGVVDHRAAGREQTRHVVHPAQGERARRLRQQPAQPLVPPARDDRQVAGAGQQAGRRVEVASDPPRTRGQQHGPAPVAGREPLPPVPLARRVRTEAVRQQRTARGGRPAQAVRHVPGDLRGEAQVEVVAPVQPLPVHGEVGDDHRAGHPEPPADPHPPGQLGGEVEDGDDRVGASVRHLRAQPVLGEHRERRGARPPAAVGTEESGVDARVHQGRVPHRRTVEAAQPGPDAGGQQLQHVPAHRLVPGRPQAPGQLVGRRVMTRPHARGDHQQAAHGRRRSSPAAVRRPGTGTEGQRGRARRRGHRQRHMCAMSTSHRTVGNGCPRSRSPPGIGRSSPSAQPPSGCLSPGTADTSVFAPPPHRATAASAGASAGIRERQASA